ncbi:MAG: tRNA (5-methylaminomethyl-2-thiouridine)(34)-methyltransferase MnmD [Prolixibacteraceae bacterium]|jgi:tRNA U34 5-methylaminomethyl-2-thiouridine-forming methyltransferase MnmC|nr:tRNA (5-methylaminomethyl-2-thiouridine)(34)-methyltransferase MnmD [Prolixibacteraceae bacterium]
MKRKLIRTEDGSHTLYIPEMDEHYHSTHGAIQESNHVFINAGFRHLKLREINILEVGLGTGLNALLTMMVCDENKQKVNYFGVEKYPLLKNEYANLNYNTETDFNYQANFLALHEFDFNIPLKLTANFSLTKINADVLDLSFENLPMFNLIYFDAFAPNKQSGIWTPNLFQKLYNACAKNAIFVTYCAQGQVRRDLQSVGFTVERIPGPPGKREMLRATKE